jgi:hypothetical protein
MTATNHALTGAVIALAVKQPVLAIPLAFLSHFAADVIPHFDIRPTRPKLVAPIAAVDSILALSLAILIVFFLKNDVSWWVIMACMFAAVSPDLVWGWRYFRLLDVNAVFTKPWSWLSRTHYNIQWSETPQGGVVELLWFISMGFLVLKLGS